MPSQRGLKLLLSVLAFPAGTGAIAHTLSGHYRSLMNFDGTFFLVQATEELYDSGIPKVPKDVEKAVEWMLERKRIDKIGDEIGNSQSSKLNLKPRSTSDNSATKEQDKPEIFKDDNKEKKNYWCRYFDYSGGKDNVIMQYDPFCTLYNIFEAPDPAIQLKQVSAGSTSQNQNHKQQTIKLSDFQNKTEDLETKRLKSNNEFKRGGFYILKLDKNKIPRANSTFTIEITKPGIDKWNSERTYQPKISSVRIQAQLTGDPADNVELTFSNSWPSSRLIVKRVTENSAGTIVDTPSETTSSSSSTDNEEATSYYFKHSNNSNDEKLHIEHAWSFGSKTQSGISSGPTVTTNTKDEKFDLSTLDRAPLKNFVNNAQSPQQTTSEEKHYLFKSVSDFWKYNVGDKIDLYKSIKPKNGQVQTLETEETKIGTFEIVAGALVNLSRSLIRCVRKDQLSKKTEFKPNLQQEEGLLIASSEDIEKDYCNKDGAPSTVLILLGYNGSV